WASGALFHSGWTTNRYNKSEVYTDETLPSRFGHLPGSVAARDGSGDPAVEPRQNANSRNPDGPQSGRLLSAARRWILGPEHQRGGHGLPKGQKTARGRRTQSANARSARGRSEQLVSDDRLDVQTQRE